MQLCGIAIARATSYFPVKEGELLPALFRIHLWDTLRQLYLGQDCEIKLNVSLGEKAVCKRKTHELEHKSCIKLSKCKYCKHLFYYYLFYTFILEYCLDI